MTLFNKLLPITYYYRNNMAIYPKVFGYTLQKIMPDNEAMNVYRVRNIEKVLLVEMITIKYFETHLSIQHETNETSKSKRGMILTNWIAKSMYKNGELIMEKAEYIKPSPTLYIET